MKRFVTAYILIALAAAGAAQVKPNFSGTWKLNTLESDFSGLPAPSARIDMIEHSEPSLKVTIEQQSIQGDQADVLYYTTDGRESDNRIGPMDVKSNVGWRGNSLAVMSVTNLDAVQMNSSSIWSLSEDGRNLTQTIHLQIGTREIDQRLLFERADANRSARSSGATVSTAAPSPARTNYSGVWRLNVARSDFGGMPAPDARVDVIEHQEPAIKIQVSQDGPDGNHGFAANLTTNGKIVASRFEDLDAKSRASWLGEKLVVDTRMNFQGSEISIETVYELSEGGSALIQSSRAIAPTGEIHQKLVFEKH